jgi:hypothetical protein
MENERDDGIITGQQEHENLAIRMKIIDMLEYALPLIERWSVAHQKLLGDKIALTMEEMLMLANEVQFSPSKKTALKKLDIMNKGLQDLILVAYKCKYLKGSKSKNEWTRRSVEVGAMIGGYSKWLYGETSENSSKMPETRRGTHGRRTGYR